MFSIAPSENTILVKKTCLKDNGEGFKSNYLACNFFSLNLKRREAESESKTRNEREAKNVTVKKSNN